MSTQSKPLPADRAQKLNHWLRRRLRGEAWQQFFEGLVFMALGLGVAAIVFYVVLVIVSLRDMDLWVIATVLLSMLGILLGGSYLTRGRAEYSGGRRDSKPLVAGVMDILLGAPDQLRLSFNCLEKCWRLRHCDVARVSMILLWLFERRRKATVEELCATLTPDEAVRILPQLRDIPGVIWLTYFHGVVMLSEELRTEIAVALNLKPTPAPAEEWPPFGQKPPPKKPRWESQWKSKWEPPKEPREESREESRAEPAENSASAEKIAWYVTLNLPPFSPLSAVKKRYHELVKIYHPDAMAGRQPGAKVFSDEQIKRINVAYDNIVENSKRARR